MSWLNIKNKNDLKVLSNKELIRLQDELTIPMLRPIIWHLGYKKYNQITSILFDRRLNDKQHN